LTGKAGVGLSRRRRRIRSSIILMGLGGGALIAGGFWLERSRNTDLADPEASVTSQFVHIAGRESEIRYTDVSDQSGLGMRHGPGARQRLLPEDTGSGLAWGDFDGDGDWDLYAVNIPGSDPTEVGTNRLFRNEGGRFVDVGETAGVADPMGFGMGASFADYDGDGDQDLCVTNYGPNRLFQNQGDGTFLDVARAAGVDGDDWSCGMAWGDVDRDGDLDLYVCNYLSYEATAAEAAQAQSSEFGEASVPYTLNPNAFDPAPNRLYLNDGRGAFVESAEECGVLNADGRSLGVTLCDLDGDGWLDLYINNDVSTNRLFRNLSGRTLRGEHRSLRFEDLSPITGTADPRGSMGLSVAELGHMSEQYDGLPDLFITHWVAQENALYQSQRYPGGMFEYRDKTRQRRLGEIALDHVGWGCALIDMDLDGQVDIAVTNGSTLEEPKDVRRLQDQAMFLFQAQGPRFWEVAAQAGPSCARARAGRGLAAADYDGDGDVDIALLENRGGLVLLRNDTLTDNRSLSIRLDGPAPQLFGASVEVQSGPRVQKLWLGADVSYLSGHAPELVFGLGQNAKADHVIVCWADGTTLTLEGVRAGRQTLSYP